MCSFASAVIVLLCAVLRHISWRNCKCAFLWKAESRCVFPEVMLADSMHILCPSPSPGPGFAASPSRCSLRAHGGVHLSLQCLISSSIGATNITLEPLAFSLLARILGLLQSTCKALRVCRKSKSWLLKFECQTLRVTISDPTSSDILSRSVSPNDNADPGFPVFPSLFFFVLHAPLRSNHAFSFQVRPHFASAFHPA